MGGDEQDFYYPSLLCGWGFVMTTVDPAHMVPAGSHIDVWDQSSDGDVRLRAEEDGK